eukprot:6204592-Pleurochrysis_carterae.AAC.2
MARLRTSRAVFWASAVKQKHTEDLFYFSVITALRKDQQHRGSERCQEQDKVRGKTRGKESNRARGSGGRHARTGCKDGCDRKPESEEIEIEGDGQLARHR